MGSFVGLGRASRTFSIVSLIFPEYGERGEPGTQVGHRCLFVVLWDVLAYISFHLSLEGRVGAKRQGHL